MFDHYLATHTTRCHTPLDQPLAILLFNYFQQFISRQYIKVERKLVGGMARNNEISDSYQAIHILTTTCITHSSHKHCTKFLEPQMRYFHFYAPSNHHSVPFFLKVYQYFSTVPGFFYKVYYPNTQSSPKMTTPFISLPHHPFFYFPHFS